MNILFADQFSDLGGGQRCLLDVIEESILRGWRATVALPGDGPFASAVSRCGAEVIHIPCGPYRSERKSFRDLLRFGADVAGQCRRLRLALSRSDFDLIYVNGPRVLPAAAAVKKRIPLLFHAHSRPAENAALRTAGVALSAAGAPVICCCRYVADGYGRWTSAKKLHVVPNGVPDLRPAMTSRRADLERPRIGIVGRIEPAKGQLLLAEAVRRLQRDGYPCALQIWGTPGPSGGDYFQAVRRAADGLDVQIVPGTEAMPRILYGLDVLAVASANEGMPRVILEAFSAGVPVLACAKGGIPEIVRDNETGFLVSDYSVEGLAQGLARVLKGSPADVQNLTSNARRAWERDHTPELYRSRIAALISQTALSRGEEGETPRLRRHTA